MKQNQSKCMATQNETLGRCFKFQASPRYGQLAPQGVLQSFFCFQHFWQNISKKMEVKLKHISGKVSTPSSFKNRFSKIRGEKLISWGGKLISFESYGRKGRVINLVLLFWVWIQVANGAHRVMRRTNNPEGEVMLITPAVTEVTPRSPGPRAGRSASTPP